MADSGLDIQDTELADKLKRGEPDAIPAIYEAYINRIYSLVFNELDRNRDTTQDVVQEIFLAAAKSAGKFRGQSRVYTWLCSIAHKKVSDFYRRKKREMKYQSKSLSSNTPELEQTPDIQLDVFGKVEADETNQAIRKALRCLPLHYRQALILKYVEELPVLDIGQVMKRSPKSVEGLLTRARRELRAVLKERNEG